MMTRSSPRSEAVSFVNNFWGQRDSGFGIIQTRIKSSMNTMQELLDYYHERINIEKEYTKKLDKLNHKIVLGSNETGTLKKSLDKLQLENDQMCKYNNKFIKSINQNNYDKLNHFMTIYTREINKIEHHMMKVISKKNDCLKNLQMLKNKYQDDCSQIKSLKLACQTTWGKELEKYETKLLKLNGANTSSELNYRSALTRYSELNKVWIRDWSISLQNFYQLEVERIQICKINCFNFCNNIATLCVDNDQSVDLARSIFAQVNPPVDLQDFGDNYGTGNKIYNPPEFVDFMAGHDEPSNKNNFTIAEFDNPDYTKVLTRTFSTHSTVSSYKTNRPTPSTTSSYSPPPLPNKDFGAHEDDDMTFRLPTTPPVGIPSIQTNKVHLPPPSPDTRIRDSNGLSPPPIHRRESQYSNDGSGVDKGDVFSMKEEKNDFSNSNGSSNYSNPTNYSSSSNRNSVSNSERNWASPRRTEKQLSQFQEQINLKSREVPNFPLNKSLDEVPEARVPITKDFSIDFIAKALEDLNSGGDGDINQYRRSVRRAKQAEEERVKHEEFRKSRSIPKSPFRPASDYVDDSTEVATRYDSISFASPQDSPLKRKASKPIPKPVLSPIVNSNLIRDDLHATCIVNKEFKTPTKARRTLLMKTPSKSYTNLHSMIQDEKKTPVTKSFFVTKAQSKYTYKPQNHGELYFKKGWQMYVIHKQEDNWYVCELAKNCEDRAGMVGLVPGNYVVEGNNLF